MKLWSRKERRKVEDGSAHPRAPVLSSAKLPEESTAWAELCLPPPAIIDAEFAKLAAREDAIARYLAAFEKGQFVHPDGRVDPLRGVTLWPVQAAIISHLCRHAPSPVSIETGFGMGTSAVVILGTRRALGLPGTHFAFDPYGLDQVRGVVVESYLAAEFRKQFCRVRERSEIGLAKFLDTRGEGIAGLIFIDGGHHFETVITDFRLADLLCCVGGYIVLDDVRYPAVETATNYIRCNRPDYAIAVQRSANLTVLQKRGNDTRNWSAFTPFAVPDRRNWEPTTDASG